MGTYNGVSIDESKYPGLQARDFAQATDRFGDLLYGEWVNLPWQSETRERRRVFGKDSAWNVASPYARAANADGYVRKWFAAEPPSSASGFSESTSNVNKQRANSWAKLVRFLYAVQLEAAREAYIDRQAQYADEREAAEAAAAAEAERNRPKSRAEIAAKLARAQKGADNLNRKLQSKDWWQRKLQKDRERLAGLSVRDRLTWLATEAAAAVAAEAGVEPDEAAEAEALDAVLGGAVSDELLDALLGPLPSEERMLEQFDDLPYDYQNLLIRDSIARVGV